VSCIVNEQARPEEFEIWKTLREKEDDDSLKDMQEKLTKHFVWTKSVFTEKCIFRRAMKRQEESINEYAMRLRWMAAHCEFGAALEAEILSQLVVGVGIDEFQRECCRTNDLDLKTALEKARGYDRVSENQWRSYMYAKIRKCVVDFFFKNPFLQHAYYRNRFRA
jgi:hypothetical protein